MHLLSQLHAGSLERIEHALVSEWNPADTNAGRIVDRVGDRRHCGPDRRLTGSIVGKIGPVRVGISVHEHDVDPGRCVGVRERGMRDPIHARHLLGVELHLLVKRAAQPVEHVAFEDVTQSVGVDYEPAVVGADEALHPDVSGFAIHFDLGDLRDDRSAAAGVRDPTSGENPVGAERFR